MISHHETGILAALRSAYIMGLFASGCIGIALTIGAFFENVWWFFDYAANYRWFLFWGLVAASILYTMASRGIASVVFLAAALVNGWLITPLWLGSQPVATGADGVRVAHADVYPGVDDPKAFRMWLQDTQADLILVAGATESLLEPLTSDIHPYTMIISPEDPDSAGIVALGREAWDVSTVLLEGRATPVYRISVGSGQRAIDVVTGWGPMGSNAEKAEALRVRLDAIKLAVDEATNPVAVIGSLGATRWTKSLRSLIEATGLRDAAEGSGYLATSPVSGFPFIGDWMGIPIDGVLMSDRITPRDLTIGPAFGTNHRALWLDVVPSR